MLTESEVGTKYAEINAFLASLAVTPWLKPGKELGAAEIAPLVQEHLRCLTVHSGTDFSHVTLRVVQTVDEYNAAWDAAIDAARDAAWDAAYNTACNAAYCAAYWTARNAARREARDAAYDAAWNAARNTAIEAAWDAAWDAACNAGHMVSGLPDNPWAPLCDIMALGAMPIGIVDNAFVVWIPSKK